MTELGDFKLDKGDEFDDHGRSRFGWRVAIIVVVLLALGISGYFLLWRKRAPAASDVRVSTEQAVAPAAPKPVAEPGENIEVPPLEQSDPVVRELVGRLSSHPKVAAWLTTDQLVRNFTLVTMTIASGRTPSRHLGRLRPAGKFETIERGTDSVIDPRSYQRYDAYADGVAAIEARGAARLYATLKPRIQDAYRELGYPDGNFDTVLQRAIVELLKTPVVEGQVALRSKSVAYEFADARLQAMSPVQRQFLRMGPRNVRMIQAKLREIAPLLGMPADSLPQ
jgi:hypothetical protein